MVLWNFAISSAKPLRSTASPRSGSLSNSKITGEGLGRSPDGSENVESDLETCWNLKKAVLTSENSLRTERHGLDLSVTNVFEQVMVECSILNFTSFHFSSSSHIFSQLLFSLPSSISFVLFEGSTTAILSIGVNFSIFLHVQLI